jgi:hypothetical protein
MVDDGAQPEQRRREEHHRAGQTQLGGGYADRAHYHQPRQPRRVDPPGSTAQFAQITTTGDEHDQGNHEAAAGIGHENGFEGAGPRRHHIQRLRLEGGGDATHQRH